MNSEQLKCVENVEIDYSTCTNKCEGLEIIGYDELDVDSKWTRSLTKILKIEKDPKLARNMELFSEQYRKYQTEGGAKGGILGDPLGPLDWFDEPLMIHGRTEEFHDRGPRGPRNCTIGIVGTSNGNMTLIIG